MRIVESLTSFYDKVRRWNTSDMNDVHNRAGSWIKTFVLAGRMFYVKDMWARDVAALTFASFMALIPCMAMLFVIVRGFGYTSMLESWLYTTFESQPVVARTIADFVRNYVENTQGNYIISAGILMLLYTVFSLMQKIERTFDDIWHTDERSWKKTVIEYPTIFFGLGLLVIFSSGFNVFAIRIVENVDTYADVGDVIPTFFLRLVSMVSLILFYVFFFCTIPNVSVKIRYTLVPSVIAGICMSMLQYGYMYLQVFLSSYNVIYGSLAAIPLFLLWMQITWAITVWGVILCYMRQNIHLYDGDLQYDSIHNAGRTKVCAVIMHHVCRNFRDGGNALTLVGLCSITGIPQQIVNGAAKELVRAGLLVEIKDKENDSSEESTMLHPIEDIRRITFGLMVERLDSLGGDVGFVLTEEDSLGYRKADELYQRYIQEGKNLCLADL